MPVPNVGASGLTPEKSTILRISLRRRNSTGPDFDLWRQQAGFEVSLDPLQCPRCPDTALTTIADKQTDTAVRFCPRCQGSWMTAEDFAGIVSALAPNWTTSRRPTISGEPQTGHQPGEEQERPYLGLEGFEGGPAASQISFFCGESQARRCHEGLPEKSAALKLSGRGSARPFINPPTAP